MSDDQSTERARSRSARAIVAGLIGAVCLVGGVVLALYSQFVAAPIPVPPDDRYTEAGDFPFRLVRGTLILASAVALIGATVLVRGRRGDERAASVNAAGVLAALAALGGGLAFAVTAHIPSTYERLTSVFTVTPRVPFAIAALAVVILGAVLIFWFAATPTAPLPRQPVLAFAVVVGLVPVLGAAGIAVRLGDDSASLDHVTAAAAPAAPVPAVVGPEKARFRISLPPRQATRTLVTRTGVAISTEDGVTVYDGATGTERWHYRRIGATRATVWNRPDRTISLRGENVVLTFWDKRGWLAFDAATGELLWTNSDFAHDSHPMVGGAALATVSFDGQVTRYDARTGRRMWTSTGEPDECRWDQDRVVSTMTTIYRAASCGAGETATLLVTALAAESGAVREQRSVATPGVPPGGLVRLRAFDSGFVWITCSGDPAKSEPATEIYLPPNQPLTSATVDSDRTNTTVHAADDAALISADDPAGRRLPKRWEVRQQTAGAAATELDMTMLDWLPDFDDPVALLDDQVITLDWNDGYELRTWDRSTGRPGPVLPVTVAPEARDLRFALVAGAVMVIAPVGNGIAIIGFG